MGEILQTNASSTSSFSFSSLFSKSVGENDVVSKIRGNKANGELEIYAKNLMPESIKLTVGSKVINIAINTKKSQSIDIG